MREPHRNCVFSFNSSRRLAWDLQELPSCHERSGSAYLSRALCPLGSGMFYTSRGVALKECTYIMRPEATLLAVFDLVELSVDVEEEGMGTSSSAAPLRPIYCPPGLTYLD